MRKIAQWETKNRHRARHKRIHSSLPKQSRFQSRRRSRMSTALWAMAVVASSTTELKAEEQMTQFDTDSELVGIDNWCTACISHNINDFVGPLHDCNRAINGFGGTKTTQVKMGTIEWKIMDDNGRVHTMWIPKSFYVPKGQARLWSPQHVAKVQKDIEGTGSETNGKQVTLYWHGKQYKKTVPLGSEDNVATFALAPGYNKFDAFCAKADLDPDLEYMDPLIVDETQVVTDDEDEVKEIPNKEPYFFDAESEERTPRQMNFDLNGPPSITVQVQAEEEDKPLENDVAELLRQQHNFGHISFQK